MIDQQNRLRRRISQKPFVLEEYQQRCSSVTSAQTSQDKGRALEELIAYLMETVPGVSVSARDVRCDVEEIDIVLWNEQIHPALRPWDSIILVECKNWQTPVGAQEIAWFLTKIRRRGISNGIFVATNGVTGDFNHDATRLIVDALSEKIRIIVLTNNDLFTIQDSQTLCHLLKEKYCKLFLGLIA